MPGRGGDIREREKKVCAGPSKNARQILSEHGLLLLSLFLSARARNSSVVYSRGPGVFFVAGPEICTRIYEAHKNTGRGSQGRLNLLLPPCAHTIFLSSRWPPRDVLWPAARVFRGRHYFSVLNSVIPGTMERLKHKI